MDSKISELGVFVLGLGVIIGAITAFVQFVMETTPGSSGPGLGTFLMLGLIIVFIVLGGLTLMVRTKPIILAAISTVITIVGLYGIMSIITTAGLLMSQFRSGQGKPVVIIFGAIVQLAFLIGVGVLTYSTGRKALSEVSQ